MFEIEFNDTKETAQRLEFSNLTSIMTGSLPSDKANMMLTGLLLKVQMTEFSY